MGCTQSKIENEEAVSRCKERKHLMKQAVSFRNAFAAAHVAYAMGLKNTGAALSDYAHGESQNQQGVAVSQPPPEPVIRPPPPPVYPTQIQRAASMPEMKMPKSREPNGVGPTILEENDDDDEDDEMEANEKLITRKKSSGRNKGGEQKSVMGEDQAPPSPLTKSSWAVQEPPSPPLQNETYDYFFGQVENIPRPTLDEVRLEDIEPKVFEERRKRLEEVEEKAKVAAVEEEKPMAAAAAAADEEMVVASVPMSGGGSVGRNLKRGKAVATGGEKMIVKGSINLVKIFEDLDDHFLKASESAHDVSKMLEATRLHYHSNFADNRGHIDHSARVMRVITWNRSFKGLDLDDVKDDFDSEEHETHATVLDKLLAWEKKLYDEVKAGELMKFEYQRKIASLNKQKKRGTNSEALEKIKAAVSHLHTRYIVDMQSMDSTVLEINRLRDEQLYPKLVQLVDGMATMWATMQTHHEQQHKIVYALRFLDLSQSPKETTEHHHERTFQLWSVVQDWHTQFCRLMDNQKDYIKALNSWLKLNLIHIESSLREKVSSPPRVTTPPIQRLLIAWLDYLERLPDEGARSAINNFAAIINTIMHHQQDEIKLKEKCEETRKELFRKNRQFEDWYHKYTQRRTPDELEPERTEDSIHKDAVQDRKFAVDMVKKRLEEEEEAYQRTCIQVREKSLTSLRTHLPELFRAMSDISLACSRMYRDLSKITMSQQQNPSESSSRA